MTGQHPQTPAPAVSDLPIPQPGRGTNPAPGARIAALAPCKDAALADREAGWRTAAIEREHRENELRTMPYKQYLQTPEWQERRKAALKRAGHSCQVCNRRRMLHVHHRTYERRGVELARDLIALCDECHALYHGKGLLASHPGEG